MKERTFKALLFLGVNLLVLGITAGVILYTLTYTAVPVQSQHLWYGKDLQTYLFWDHLGITIIGVFALGIFNTLLAIELRHKK